MFEKKNHNRIGGKEIENPRKPKKGLQGSQKQSLPALKDKSGSYT